MDVSRGWLDTSRVEPEPGRAGKRTAHLNMTAILKHNLDMSWETSPAHERVTLKKARLTPRPFTVAPRGPWGATPRRAAPAARGIQRKVRANPAVLRALRDAEMAAWNKAVPAATATARLAAIPVREAQREAVLNQKAELRLYSFIAAIGAVAVVEGFWGLSALLDRWSAFANFVQRIFAAN